MDAVPVGVGEGVVDAEPEPVFDVLADRVNMATNSAGSYVSEGDAVNEGYAELEGDLETDAEGLGEL